MYIKIIKVKDNNGDFMKKLILLFILLLLFFSISNKEDIVVFNEEEDETYKNYILEFNECDLSTNNFISILSFFNDKDYKILELVPYKNNKDKYYYYSNNLDNILIDFKTKYINNLLEEDKFTNNICIKNIKINTSNYNLNLFKNIINFKHISTNISNI